MKKRIFTVIAVFCLVVSLSATAFASNYKLPPVPTGSGELIITRYESGTIRAYYLDSWTRIEPNFVVFYGRECTSAYNFNGNSWSTHDIDAGSTYQLNKSEMVYDSTGRFLSDSLVEFISPIGFDDFGKYYDNLAGQITVSNVITVIAYGVSIIVGIVFMWWGVRKAVRAIMSAFRKGRVSL